MNNNTMVKDEKAAKKAPGSSDHSNMASDNTDMASDNTNDGTYVLGSGMGWPAISPVPPDSKSDDSESGEDEFLASFRRGDHKKMVQVKDTVYVPGPQSSGCDQPKFEKDHAAQRVEALQAERDLKRKRG